MDKKLIVFHVSRMVDADMDDERIRGQLEGALESTGWSVDPGRVAVTGNVLSASLRCWDLIRRDYALRVSEGREE